MDKKAVESIIESRFRKKVQRSAKVRNAYLLVHSDKLNIHLNLAEGKTGNVDANPNQPLHLASVGKLFTATITGILHDRGELSFDDKISKYLNSELMDQLHVYKGKDYSDEIKISHLLKQTSGLYDVFYKLYKKLLNEPQVISPRDAVLWGKQNLKPVAEPGKKHFYTDTNYYLLGLIIENVTGKPYHEVLHEFIFNPLGMKNAYMHGFSHPAVPSVFPAARLYIKNVDLFTVEGLAHIDYAGGGVVAPAEEFLLFMKALLNHQLVKKETLNRMLNDDIPMGFPTPGFNYGYSIWKFKTIPVLLPEKLTCWGCVGATGAFMFYHPKTESTIIGSFNDFSFRSKALQFMVGGVVKTLLKFKQ
ncbi:MAG TPA: class C beta-lactamase-related serine hydrolase [Mariniphaga anaerophila]|uniref:Class C beta-lactamase-related serine hydrolase n=1 Tax=Mariniphaga anaerophila TaxID=1484053 RepID=A0A831PRN8_9BACT|nr:class C beta-lactamase-related serine hydrolase [Mariniphaga anaerophila]